MTSAVAAVVGDGGEAKVTVRLGAMSGVELVTRPPPAIAGDVAVDEAIAIVGDVHTSLANLSTKRIGSGRVMRLNLGKKNKRLRRPEGELLACRLIGCPSQIPHSQLGR